MNSRGVGYAALTFSAFGVDAVRSYRILQHSNLTEDDGRSAWHVIGHCPEECLECGLDYLFSMNKLINKPSTTLFKCILRDPWSEFQAGRGKMPLQIMWNCDEVKPRKGAGVTIQAKTDCYYTTEDKAGSIWNTLQPVSEHSRCCCDSSDDWTKDVCFPLDTFADFVSDPEGNRYKRIEDQLQYNRGECKTEAAKERRVVTEFQETRDGPKITTGCCLQAQEITEPDGLTWTKCLELEKIYRCATEGEEGVRGGMAYRREPAKPGMCIGDRSTPGRLKHANPAWSEEIEKMDRARAESLRLRVQEIDGSILGMPNPLGLPSSSSEAFGICPQGFSLFKREKGLKPQDFQLCECSASCGRETASIEQRIEVLGQA